MDRRTFATTVGALALLPLRSLAAPEGAALHPGSAQWATAPDNAARISQKDFKKLVAKNDVIILDTRNEDVYKLGHIPGALLLPLEGLESFDEPQYTPLINSLKTAKKPIVAYCA